MAQPNGDEPVSQPRRLSGRELWMVMVSLLVIAALLLVSGVAAGLAGNHTLGVALMITSVPTLVGGFWLYNSTSPRR